jgi:RNA polymerase sigma-70 factor (ECF subfamily)
MAEELDDLTLQRAQRGESPAFAALVERYQRPVHALVGRMLVGRGSPTVDDVAQEAFLRVYRGLPRFDPRGPARLGTWILTVATRACLNALRDHPRDVPAAEPARDVSSEASDPERSAADRDLARRVATAMAGLPEDQRAVLVLRAYHDFDYDEIAAALEVPVGTVKSRLGRAREALRQIVAETEEEEPRT